MYNVLLILSMALAFSFGVLLDRSLTDATMQCVPKQPPVQAEGGY